jgi:hypothetical protein
MGDDDVWRYVDRVTRPALMLAPETFLDDAATSLSRAGVQGALARRHTATLFDWLVALISLQGVSDAIAFDYDARHGGITFAEIDAALRADPSCARLQSYWSFEGCRYRKSVSSCAEPNHLPGCSLLRHRLRKGTLNVAAYSLFLFLRDVCAGDLVGWIDKRLARADASPTSPEGAAHEGGVAGAAD